MSQQEILTLAKEGDATAIAFLISQALGTKGIAVKATRQNTCLHLLLEAEQLPPQDACIRVIVKGLLRLEAAQIYYVKVYGRRINQQLVGWTQIVELKQPLGSRGTEERGKIPSYQSPVTSHPSPVSRHQPPVTSPQPPVNRHPLPKRTTGNPWLLVGSVSSVLIPLSGFVITSQLQQPPGNVLTTSEIVSLKPIPSTSASPVPRPTQKATAKPILKPITKPVTTTQVTNNVTEVSNVTLPSPKNAQFTTETITIKAVGDIIPGSNYPYNKLPKDEKILFKSVKPYLQGADILFGNFESTLTDYRYSSKGGGGGMLFAFRTPPSYVKLLKDAGFHILNVANNHSWDFHEQGFKDTIKNIDGAGMTAVGKKGQIVYKNVKGVNVAFIGFSNYGDVHNSLLELKAGEAIVKEAKKKADIVVISVHAGAEGTGALRVRNHNEFFFGENRGNMVLFSRTMIDAGADLILGHGPHVARALELYKGKLIAYSLGNFMGYRSLSTAGELGESLILQVQMNPKGDFVSGKIIPVQLNGQGIPAIDNNFRSVGLIRELTKGDFPNTPLKIDEKGQILKK
ncbi:MULTISPECIES: CapA family protein [Kamptonema]|uniref:CapA family protein n=1 Tax=Kamptonema TaxID=1501433 RepID=UPI0001DAC1D5|nr:MULTISPECIES: CapA family protein [Kamptonema]CBN58978.1 putative poly-gamma-glutamate biosynthesis protein [Kamptonema sp. PCC 6506]